jgi:hypothetical protein
MHLKEWLKSAAVACGGGAVAAVSAIMMDPSKFNLSNGLKDEFLIALQGALVGLGALFIRSPLGSSMVRALQDAKQQAAEDRAALDKIKADTAGGATMPPPTGPPPVPPKTQTPPKS